MNTIVEMNLNSHCPCEYFQGGEFIILIPGLSADFLIIRIRAIIPQLWAVLGENPAVGFQNA